jgi:hypothetical protein
MRRSTAFPILWGFILLFSLSSPIRLNSQNNKSGIEIYDIRKHYESGRFEEVLRMRDQLEALFRSTEPRMHPEPSEIVVLEEFSRLYILSCLAMDDAARADSTMRDYLERFPDQAIARADDSPQYRRLKEKYLLYNAREFGVIASTGLLAPYTGPSRSLAYQFDAQQSTNRPPRPVTSGYDIGFTSNFHFASRHSLLVDATLSFRTIAETFTSNEFDAENPTAGMWEFSLRESLGFVQIPIQYQHRILISQFNAPRRSWITLNGGGYIAGLFRDVAEIESREWKNDSSFFDQHQVLGSNRDHREVLHYGLVASVGYQLDLEKLSLFARLGGHWGLNELGREGSEFDEDAQEIQWNYHVTYQNAALQYYQIALGATLRSGVKVKIRKPHEK